MNINFFILFLIFNNITTIHNNTVNIGTKEKREMILFKNKTKSNIANNAKANLTNLIFSIMLITLF